ncbi:MAG TPA: DUF4251 domain-containing protein [Mucilaginibacter sp.]
MKNLIKISFVMLITAFCLNTSNAQTKQDKKAIKAAEITRLVNLQNYVFVANYVSPSRGGGRALTSEYDMSVSKDSIVAFLPYFGRAYMADYGSNDGGIKFTLTHFDYKVTNNKKNNWDIIITPKNKNMSDPKAVRTLRLSISSDGYASLQVLSENRDPISFNGYIEQKSKPKK